MIYDDPYKDGLANIAMDYSRLVPEKMLSMFVRFETPAVIMNSFYNVLVGSGEIKKLEDLSEQEKRVYWNQVKDFEITQEKKIKISRALYVFKQLK